MFDKGIIIFKRFRYIYFLMDFKNSVKVNICSAHMVLIVGMFAVLSIGSIVTHYMGSGNENIAFAQSANTTNSNTNTGNSKNNLNMTIKEQQQQSQVSLSPNFTRSLGSI